MGLLIGSIGATIVLFAFAMNQKHIWNNDSVQYDFWNLIGSILLFISAFIDKSWPFVILNFVWALFSAKDLLVYFSKKR